MRQSLTDTTCIILNNLKLQREIKPRPAVAALTHDPDLQFLCGKSFNLEDERHRTRRERLSTAPLHICSKVMASYPTPVSQTITIHNIPISRVSLNTLWVEAKCSWWSCCFTYRGPMYAFHEDVATTSSRLMNETRAFRGRTRGDITSAMNWSKSTYSASMLVSSLP